MSSKVEFHVLSQEEATALQQHGHGHNMVRPKHVPIECGSCGSSTNARVVASAQRKADGMTIMWCVCACEKEEPCVLMTRAGNTVSQFPQSRHFTPGERWPSDLVQLYDEAAKSYSAEAYTAATMVARKLLMAIACKEGATDGKPFVEYVDYITTRVLAYPKAKDSIDRIRLIGNDANHSLQFVSRDDARRAIEIIGYIMNTIYSLPSA